MPQYILLHSIRHVGREKEDEIFINSFRDRVSFLLLSYPAQWKSVPHFCLREYTYQKLKYCLDTRNMQHINRLSTLHSVSGRMSTNTNDLSVNTIFCGGYLIWTDFGAVFGLRVAKCLPTLCYAMPGLLMCVAANVILLMWLLLM